MNTDKFKKFMRTAAICCTVTVISAAPAASFASSSPHSGNGWNFGSFGNWNYWNSFAGSGSCWNAGSGNNGGIGGDENTTEDNETTDSGSSGSGSDSNETPTLSGYASEVFSLLNSERNSNGQTALKYSSAAAEIAQKKADDMAANKYFSHTSPTYGSAFDMLKAAGVTYSSAGENIAKGQRSPAAVMNSWMNSSGHRANILSSSYSSVGIGCAADSSGTLYWVQVFIG